MVLFLRAMASRTAVFPTASKGFGSGRNVPPKKVKQAPPGWTQVGRTSDLVDNKPIKAVEVGRNAVVLVRSGEEFFCTDAKSTAYQFPLVDANLVEVEGKPAIECPLDGTVYDLRTGKVLEWCPKNNVIRAFLGKLKEKDKPIKLQTYPLSVGEEGEIYVKL